MQRETQTLGMFLVLNELISLEAQLAEQIFTLLGVFSAVVQSFGSEYASL
jgi:hypothetical protein